jgi:putative N6-adenine-specific DNA methylase
MLAQMNNKAIERKIKRHIIAADNKVFLAIQPGLEEAGEIELEKMELQAQREKEPGSLTSTANLEDLWRLVLTGRSFSRIYLRLKEFKAEGFKELKKKIKSIPWELYLKEGCEYRVRITTAHSRLYVHDKIIKAIHHSMSEHFISLEGQPPRLTDSKEKDPTLQTVIIRAVDDHFTISLDAGGGALYERGYRQNINEAPLKENIAAALLILSGIDKKTMILDPMCGSGTFSLEALSISSGSLTSTQRHYPFEYWPSFRPGRFDWLVKQLKEAETKPLEIIATDIDIKSLEAAEKNLNLFKEQSGLDKISCRFERKDFFDTPESYEDTESAFIILNPPYGKRLPLKDQMDFFKNIGKMLKTEYRGIDWGIIAPGLECERALDLKWRKKYLFKNGGFPVSFIIGRS